MRAVGGREQHLARVHADAQGEGRPFAAAGNRPYLFLHRQRRRHGPFRVVIAGCGHPEIGQNAVAGMLLDVPAPGDDDLIQPLPEAVDGIPHLFRVHRLGHGRIAGEIGGEDGHLLALGQRLGLQALQAFLQRRNSRLHDAVAQDVALCFQRADRRRQLPDFVGAGHFHRVVFLPESWLSGCVSAGCAPHIIAHTPSPANEATCAAPRIPLYCPARHSSSVADNHWRCSRGAGPPRPTEEEA